MLAIHLVLVALLASTSPSTAASIPNPARLSASLSNTEAATLPANSPNALVDPQKHPDWAGAMDPDHCRAAWSKFRFRATSFPPLHLFTFWSRQWIEKPRGPAIELPLGARHGTCALLLRMGKDFGDDVLPLPSGGFLPTWWYPPRATFTWRDVEVAAFSLLQDVSQHGVPGWTKPSWATVLYVPQTSAMSREWTAGLRSPWDLVGEASVLGNLTHETV